MQTKHLFSQTNYKTYLNERLDEPNNRGTRAAFARAIGCQSAYVSSVLRGHVHFTPEQGESINDYFGHTESESDYFLLLLQCQRAGTEPLRKRLSRQMEKIRETRFDLKKRLNVTKELTEQEQALFYSEWYFAAIHALVSIPGFQGVQQISSYLGLETGVVARTIDFLLRTGLLEQSKSGLKIGQAQTHLGADSPFISKHHVNWRLLAMQKLAIRSGDNLHYSSVITLSNEDAIRIKESLVSAIKEAKKVIRDSKEETLQCFTLDFFKV